MSIRQRIRGPAKTYYHYLVTNKDSEEKEYYKTISEINTKYGISRGNIYLMCKNPNVKRRKYNDITIEKIHLHYLVVEQDIDPISIV
tara:strand:+ start:276 stop:536 length:261 start_codon:yes stop_codon:yes gene_type:complete